MDQWVNTCITYALHSNIDRDRCGRYPYNVVVGYSYSRTCDVQQQNTLLTCLKKRKLEVISEMNSDCLNYYKQILL